MRSCLAEQVYGKKNLNTPNRNVSERAVNVYNELYGNLTDELEEIHKRILGQYPFRIFSPRVPLFKNRKIVKAIDENDLTHFIRDTKDDFFPDKSEEEAFEGRRLATNRIIKDMNELCKTNLSEYHHYFTIPKVNAPFNPLEMLREAREKYEKAIFAMHRYSKHPELMYDAFNAARAWGLGYLTLMIDESPTIFNSVEYREAIKNSLWQRFEFKNPHQFSENLFSWDTKFGVRVYGTEKEPFRQRAKIHDDDGKIKYHSLLMKMTLNKQPVEKIRDTYGIEFILENENDTRRLMSFFNIGRYEHVVREDPPFSCEKFSIGIAARVSNPSSDQQYNQFSTIKMPLTKYIRPEVEMQLITLKTFSMKDHPQYKKQKYLKVFPIWYPDSIYTPLIVKSIDG